MLFILFSRMVPIMEHSSLSMVGQLAFPAAHHRSKAEVCMCRLFLTTLGDIHLLQGNDGSIHGHAVQLLVLQVCLTLLLPELNPADITAAVKRVSF